ncbi:MAG TPA: MFS transporter [Chthonomonadaceae bacterium]|nr:MFS transporter [Chthonomonadaceae bacterium]
MSFNLRWRLTLMMVLEYGIWGAWFAVAGEYFGKNLGFNGIQIGVLFSLLPLATIISPFIAGQIADRHVNTEKFLAILNLLGGVLMFWIARQHEYRLLVPLLFIYSLFYAPTLALTNSLTFHHLSSAERDFGGIRVGGTLGWIIANWLLGLWRQLAGHPVSGDLFYLAGILSILLGLFCFALPKTPPAREGTNPLAFLEALALLKSRSFLIFMIVSFIVGTELEFFYMFTSAFLGAPVSLHGIGISDNNLPIVMTVAQIAEAVVMLSLPFVLPRLGVRKGLTLGIIAWPIRYAIFAFLPIQWLVIASLALHGFCYVFFFVVGFIYVDEVAPKDIRASAQSLVALTVLGLGLYFGSLFAGQIQKMYTTIILQGGKPVSVTDWHMVFLIPCILTLLCAIIFPLLFRGDTSRQAVVAGEAAEFTETAPVPK